MADTSLSKSDAERREGSNPSWSTMLTEKTAKALAEDIEYKNKKADASVGSFVTNGIRRFVVNVTHEEPTEDGAERPRAYTVS